MKPDCRTCGACCVSFYEQDVFCDVTDADIQRLSHRFVQENIRTIDFQIWSCLATTRDVSGAIKTKWVEARTGPLKGYRLNVCQALRGSVMSRVSCSIYKNRPKTCREAVKPGSNGCLEVRRAFERTIKGLNDE